MKPLKKPEGRKNLDFHNAQVTARKDVERDFGILQAQFTVVRGPARFWDQKIFWQMMTSCEIKEEDFEYDRVGTSRPNLHIY